MFKELKENEKQLSSQFFCGEKKALKGSKRIFEGNQLRIFVCRDGLGT
jgi:hypothetical protein